MHAPARPLAQDDTDDTIEGHLFAALTKTCLIQVIHVRVCVCVCVCVCACVCVCVGWCAYVCVHANEFKHMSLLALCSTNVCAHTHAHTHTHTHTHTRTHTYTYAHTYTHRIERKVATRAVLAQTKVSALLARWVVGWGWWAFG